jgi:hypothetical protein
MTCSEVQRILPEFLGGAPDGALQTDFQTHLKSCPDCSDLVSDLQLITSEARQLTASEEPPARVWVRIAAELRAEGLIREPESAPVRPILVPTSRRRRWTALWLAPVAATVLAAGAYVITHQPASPVARQQVAPTVPSPVATQTAVANPPSVTPAPDTASPVPTPAQRQLAHKSTPPLDSVRSGVEPEPSAEDRQFLSVVSTRAPSMRAAYENQLQAVNADIRETQAYVNRYPGDADARQHLMDAYEQKALLYRIALDRIQ